MFARILVPLDGSKSAEQVLPYVELLARSCNASVVLLRVVEHLPPEWMDWIVGSQPTQIAAGMSDRAQEYIESVSSLLSRKGLQVLR